jgi:hypothetical protein
MNWNLMKTISIFLFFLILFAGWKVQQNSKKEIEINKQIASQFKIKPLLIRAIKFSGKKPFEIVFLKKLQETAKNHHNEVKVWLSAFCFLSLMLIGLNYFYWPRSIVISIILISVVAYCIGITSPVLTISMSKQIPILGEVIVQHQSKSIVDGLFSLIQIKSYLVAFVLFSMGLLIPILKTILFLFVLISDCDKKKYLKIIPSIINTSSMAEIFTICLFVMFLSFKDYVDSKAQLEIGFYFFLGYSLISLVCGALHNRRLHKENSDKNTGLT